MRKITIITCFITLMLSDFGFCQNVAHEFGKVSMEEIMLKQYSKDPDASALVLFDIGKSVFIDNDNGFEIHFTRTKRIKIFNKAGLDYAEIEIPYYQDGFGKTELVADIEAYTYNLEFGKIVKSTLDPKNIFVDKRTEKWNLKKFALPQVKEGSVIEIKYTLKTPFKYNLQDWVFQDKIPTLYSEYEARMIPFYEYSYIFQGASKFDHFESYEQNGVDRQFGALNFRDMVYKFVMKDVPAFEDESYISSINDYIIKLDFQLSKFTNYQGVQTEIVTTWPKLSNDLLKRTSFGKYINASENASKRILEDELALSGKSELEKFEAIVDYVKKNFTWDGFSSRFASKKVKDLLNEKAGNSAEINLFLTGMLVAAGFESHPVLVSTRSNGKIPADYPFEHFFNDVISIVKIGDAFVLTDGTEDLSQYNRIPYRCINDKGLMVVKDSEIWVTLSQNQTSIQQEELNLEILPTGDSLACRVSRKMTEYTALNYRNEYKNKKELISKALLNEGFYHVDNILSENYENTSSPYGVSFESIMPIERYENKLFIKPFLNLPIGENILKQEKRKYPVDMVYQNRRIFKSNLAIPNAYKVTKVPESYIFEDDLVQILFSTKVVDGIISTEGSYFFKKSVYHPEEYEKLKSDLDKLVKTFNGQIVLSHEG